MNKTLNKTYKFKNKSVLKNFWKKSEKLKYEYNVCERIYN